MDNLAKQSTSFKTFTQMMADFTFGLSYDAVPPEVRDIARRHLADTMACALGATNTTAAFAVRQYAAKNRGVAQATILGTREKVSAGLAALTNGTMVRYLDANDIFVLTRGGGVQGSPQAFAPASREAADHSTPYVMAMALLRGRLTAREYEGAPWETAEVKALMGKIELVRDSEMDRRLDTEGILGVRLVAELTNGSVEEIIIHQPKGHPDAPLSDSDLLDKMSWLLETVAPAHTPERLLELCSGLSTVDDVIQLIAACDATT